MFQLDKPTLVLCTNANPRRELHGDEHVRAIDLTFCLSGENIILDLIAPGLRAHHFHNAAFDARQEPLPLGAELPLPDVRFPKLPMAYPWGTKQTAPADFVAAWRHIHDLFAKSGATNVIWIWDPNDVYPVPDIKLQPLYPGDQYVDWIGVTGYWTVNGPHTYSSLFLPTLLDIRGFTNKPFIIAETGVQAGANQVSSVNALFKAVATHEDILGFVWYDYNRQGDWRLENRPTVQAAFRSAVAASQFGFTVSATR